MFILNIISGIQVKDQLMIFRILAAILHFGNIKIREKEGEACEVPVRTVSQFHFIHRQPGFNPFQWRNDM